MSFLSFSSFYDKQTFTKAVKKMLRVLPDDQNKQHKVLKRIGQNLGLIEKQKVEGTQTQISKSVEKKIQDFYGNNKISCRATGECDYLTTKKHGNRVQYSKRHLLYNIREIHELFIQENPGMNKYFSLK
jgi:hypothetical protein